jgi:ATP-dependent RNA helicase DDX46/PRP5
MTDLYAAGDVAVQSSFTDSVAAAAAAADVAAADDDGVATLEDILGISCAGVDGVAGAGDVSDEAMDVEEMGTGGVDHAAFLAAMRARDDDTKKGESPGAGGSGANSTGTVDACVSVVTSATGTGTGTGADTVVGGGSGSGLGLMMQDEGDVMDEKQLAARKEALLAAESRGTSVNKASRPMVGVDHSTIDYAPFRKNLYIVPKALAALSKEAVNARREELTVKVRGQACPAPVDSWDQCGLSERTLQVITKLGFAAPFAIQCQAMPAIMAGRDVLAVAKTGSGKTMAFLLPMFRHVLDQPPLAHGDGPIGVIIAPARELAVQIHAEARRFARILGMRVACAYGGAGIGEQIAELKRGAEIVVCTPGRLIDILYNSGKVTNMQRTTMVVMDEADRMFDMGFEPQVNLILQNVRPDRQVVLFSATFPRAIEQLARKTLQFPLEVVVGERSVVNKDITQHVEVRATDQHKFLRLLQVLGLWYDKGSTLIFVDKQETCDELFAELCKAGYPTLSLHGGIEQMDRDHTLHEFKTLQKKVMVATSVAGRGLDVPDCACVVNYNCPNHLEDYVHRVGRTGRAGRKGTSFTFVTPEEEAYSPFLKEVLTRAGATVPVELQVPPCTVC